MIAIVTGASSGLGFLIKKRIEEYTLCHVLNWSLETGVDVTEKQSLLLAKKQMITRYGEDQLGIIVNCAGYNQPDFIENMSEINWDMTMSVNAKSIWMMAKHLAKEISGGVICNIISNASHVPMTHSISYNASKAAAEMMTRQMAKELWKTHGIRVFGVSPNKMRDTKMSERVDAQCAALRNETVAQAKAYQLSKLLTGEETDPDCVAEFVGWLLSEPRRWRYIAGSVMEYGA